MSVQEKELITTGLFFDKNNIENYIFAGEWCFRDDPLLINNSKLNLLPQAIDFDKLEIIERDIYEAHETILLKIAELYNEYFGINKSLKYYDIVIGRWLFHFLNNVYEKIEILNKASESSESYYTKYLGNRPFPSVDSDDYNQKSYFSHEFNFFLFSAVSTFSKNIKTDNIDVNYSDFYNINYGKSKSFKNKIFSLYQEVFCILNRAFHNKLILVVSPYYPRNTQLNSLWFFLKSFGKIVHYKFRRTNTKQRNFDIDLRETFNHRIKSNSTNKLLTVGSQIVFSFIPISFFENFVDIRLESIKWLKKNNEVKTFFTANAIHTEELFKYIVAESTNSKLYISQHGFGYGTNKVMSSEVYEQKFANSYFTWGWGQLRLPNPKLSQVDIFNYIKNTRIVLTFPSLTHYGGIIDMIYLYNTDLSELIYNSNYVINKIKAEFKSEVYVRQQKKRELKFISIDAKQDSYKSFQESLFNSRIHLTNHFGTPFLESIAMNVPTIVIHTDINKYVRQEALDDFELLKNIHVLFNDPEEAVVHINSVYLDINSWWSSSETQNALNFFRKKYCFASNQWKQSWFDALIN